MLDSKNRMKLVDFGTARDMNNPEIKGSGNSAKGKKIFDHFVGTPQYMAPECIHNKDSNFKCDIWSLGCILYQFLAGYPPFNGGSEYVIFMKSTAEKPIFYDYLFSTEAKDLITKMLERDMEKRLSLEEVMKHPYFEGIDFDNLPTYEEAEAKITQFEAFLISLKGRFLAFKGQDQPEKAKEHVDKVFNEAAENIEKHPDFTNDEKEKLLVRVKLMKEQALGYYGVEDFEWEGMKKDFFSHIKRPQPESSDEEDDSDD
jgi:Serine/threonine protein kinase